MDLREDLIALTARKPGSRLSRGGTIVTAVAPLRPRRHAEAALRSTGEDRAGERANRAMNTLKTSNDDRVVPYLWRIRAQFFN